MDGCLISSQVIENGFSGLWDPLKFHSGSGPDSGFDQNRTRDELDRFNEEKIWFLQSNRPGENYLVVTRTWLLKVHFGTEGSKLTFSAINKLEIFILGGWNHRIKGSISPFSLLHQSGGEEILFEVVFRPDSHEGFILRAAESHGNHSGKGENCPIWPCQHSNKDKRIHLPKWLLFFLQSINIKLWLIELL